MAHDARGLVPLHEMDDFEVADGYTDIRGFEAYLRDGRKVGRVHELLVDAAASRVGAITLDLDGDATAGRDSRVHVPIEDVEIDTPGRRVLVAGAGLGAVGLAGAGAAAAQRAPGIGRQDETTGRATGAAEQRITLAEEELELHRQRMAAGSVDVHKHVETSHVRENVPVMREEVSVERRPVTDPNVGTEARFEGDEIRIPVVEEELVVEKRPVVREELVVRKRAVEGSQVVEADLRRERAEVHGTGEGRDAIQGDRSAADPLRGGRDLDGDGVR